MKINFSAALKNKFLRRAVLLLIFFATERLFATPDAVMRTVWEREVNPVLSEGLQKTEQKLSQEFFYALFPPPSGDVWVFNHDGKPVSVLNYPVLATQADIKKGAVELSGGRIVEIARLSLVPDLQKLAAQISARRAMDRTFGDPECAAYEAYRDSIQFRMLKIHNEKSVELTTYDCNGGIDSFLYQTDGKNLLPLRWRYISEPAGAMFVTIRLFAIIAGVLVLNFIWKRLLLLNQAKTRP